MKKMRNILHRIRWFIYIGFFCLFLKGLGVYRSMVHGLGDQFEETEISGREFFDFERKVQLKTDSITKVRREEFVAGDEYTFADYASDFAEIDNFILSAGQDPDRYLMAKNSLVNFMHERVRVIGVKEGDRIEAEGVYSSMTGVFGKFSDYSDPEMGEEKEISWGNLWGWIARKYLKFFPIAFILYLFWFFTDTRASRYMKRNPLSLLFSLAIYPLVIFMLIRDLFIEKAREALVETDYRRTKDEFFSVLSKDEIGRIKSFARSSRKLFEWRKELQEEGRIFKHSFVLVLTFTIFLGFMFSATSVCAESKFDQRTEIYQFVKEKTDSTVSVWDCHQIVDDGILSDIIPWPRLLFQKIKSINKPYILENGFIPDIGHIPNSVSNHLLKTELIY